MTSLPVLLIAFNRPDPTNRVLSAIRPQRPSRLYVAVDGPRPGRADDIRNCAEVRKLVDSVDWQCEVRTLFREANLGCGPGVFRAIEWFFAHEEAGAILEDDCVPHPDFLDYCAWALERYRDDRRVWHIGGNNFGAVPEIFAGRSADFIGLAQVWGWATWRDRWSAYEYDAGRLLEAAGDHWRGWRIPPAAAKLKLRDLKATVERRHTWDFQWQVTVLNHHGLALVPGGNLITNIGDGKDATHTPGDDRCWLPLMETAFDRAAWAETVPEPEAVNERLQAHFMRHMNLLRHRGSGITRYLRKAKELLRLHHRSAARE
jgi:hypothetical protein